MAAYEPNVFISESLRFEDEAAERLEGKFISHILKLNDKKSKCYYSVKVTRALGNSK